MEAKSSIRFTALPPKKTSLVKQAFVARKKTDNNSMSPEQQTILQDTQLLENNMLRYPSGPSSDPRCFTEDFLKYSTPYKEMLFAKYCNNIAKLRGIKNFSLSKNDMWFLFSPDSKQNRTKELINMENEMFHNSHPLSGPKLFKENFKKHSIDLKYKYLLNYFKKLEKVTPDLVYA